MQKNATIIAYFSIAKNYNNQGIGMLSSTQLATMLDLQNDMNKKVNPAWLSAGYSYLRAALIESIDHL